jgi:hypothetical protein
MWAKAIEISFNKKPENCPGVERFFGLLPAFDISSSVSVIFQALCDSRNESFAPIVLISLNFFLTSFQV